MVLILSDVLVCGFDMAHYLLFF